MTGTESGDPIERMERIEVRLAYVERTLDELDGLVQRVFGQLDGVLHQVGELRDAFEVLAEQLNHATAGRPE